MGKNIELGVEVLLENEAFRELVESKICELFETDAMRDFVTRAIANVINKIGEEQLQAALDDVVDKGFPVKTEKGIQRVPLVQYIKTYLDLKFSQKWVEMGLKKAIDIKLRQICTEARDQFMLEFLVPKVMNRLAEEYANEKEE